ncbi:MAG: shikimate dehydrogenase [Actinomycetota bacterium]|nr:shikimate dehydrogenase [Actinomycetota bacterium]
MRRFAFLIHPLDMDDVESFEPGAKGRPPALVKKVLLWMCERPPFIGSFMTGVRSKTRRKAEGWFITIPLLPEQMGAYPELARSKIVEAINKAEELGASIVGLGAFTSVVTNGGLAIRNEVNIPVTTGNSYTVAAAIEGTKKAAKLMGIRLSGAKLAVVGATGSIGRACTEVIAPQVARLVLVGRTRKALEIQAVRLRNLTEVDVSTEIHRALRDADVVITASSDAKAIITADDLESGTVVCDVAQPPDVSRSVLEKRDDVLVFEGGIIRIPGLRVKRKAQFAYDFRLKPDKYAYACMAETMILCLEGIDGDFSVGGVKVNQVEKISRLAEKHGFKIGGFRSFERRITREQIREIRRNAAKKSNRRWFYRLRRRMQYIR